MKSGVAAMAAAAVRAANDNKAEGLALLITSDEEGEAEYGTKHVVAWLKERGFTIPYALVGEPAVRRCWAIRKNRQTRFFDRPHYG